jgi:hypothetical protein
VLAAFLTFLPRSEALLDSVLLAVPLLLARAAQRGDFRLRRRVPERAIARGTLPT